MMKKIKKRNLRNIKKRKIPDKLRETKSQLPYKKEWVKRELPLLWVY